MRSRQKHEHVLANLDRVEPLPWKIASAASHRRFQLDGWECTMQIIALMARKKVQRLPSGALVRLSVEGARAE